MQTELVLPKNLVREIGKIGTQFMPATDKIREGLRKIIPF